MKQFIVILFLFSLPVTSVFAEPELNGNPVIPNNDASHTVSRETFRLDRPVEGIKVKEGEQTTTITAPTPTPVLEPQQAEVVFIEPVEPTIIPTVQPTPTSTPTPLPTQIPQTNDGNIVNSFTRIFRIPLDFLFGLFD